MKEKLVLGIAPIKKGFLSMEVAKKRKEQLMNVIRNISQEKVKFVDIDDICKNGIAFERSDADKVVHKFKQSSIDALFIPFCDFGEESVAASISSTFDLPTLVWDPRNEVVNTDETRGTDTQCGIIAVTKVFARYGIKYSYIINSMSDSPEFKEGFMNFLRVANTVKTTRNMRIVKIGNRPVQCMSVIASEAQLLERFGIPAIPLSSAKVARIAMKIMERTDDAYREYYNDYTQRVDCSTTNENKVKRAVAVKIAIQDFIEKNGCLAASMECWSSAEDLMGVVPCMVLGEMANAGMPIACEGDIKEIKNGR